MQTLQSQDSQFDSLAGHKETIIGQEPIQCGYTEQKGMVPGGLEQGCMRFLHATQDDAPFKTYECLFLELFT